MAKSAHLWSWLVDWGSDPWSKRQAVQGLAEALHLIAEIISHVPGQIKENLIWILRTLYVKVKGHGLVQSAVKAIEIKNGFDEGKQNEQTEWFLISLPHLHDKSSASFFSWYFLIFLHLNINIFFYKSHNTISRFAERWRSTSLMLEMGREKRF